MFLKKYELILPFSVVGQHPHAQIRTDDHVARNGGMHTQVYISGSLRKILSGGLEPRGGSWNLPASHAKFLDVRPLSNCTGSNRTAQGTISQRFKFRLSLLRQGFKCKDRESQGFSIFSISFQPQREIRRKLHSSEPQLLSCGFNNRVVTPNTPENF